MKRELFTNLMTMKKVGHMTAHFSIAKSSKFNGIYVFSEIDDMLIVNINSYIERSTNP